MKKLVSFILGLAVIAILHPTASNAQPEQGVTEIFVETWNPCGNDGQGEMMTGTLRLHHFELFSTTDETKARHENVMNSDLVGETTGDVYHALGGVCPKWPMNTFQLNYYIHYVGPNGSHYVMKILLHSTINANGEETAFKIDTEFGCR